MGIGWGSKVMKGSDFNSCKFTWYNRQTDAFTFHDWSYPYTADDGVFVLNETFNIVSNSTVNNDRSKGAYTCEFKRLLKTGGSEYDYDIPTGKEVNIVYAYGEI